MDTGGSIVRLDGVRKTYALGSTEVHALRGVDFSVSPGDFVAIAGPSGSGKSTVLNLLGCIDIASGGSVLVFGRDTGRMDDEELTALRHAGIGFIFQSFNLVPVLSVVENIELPLLLEGRASKDRGGARRRGRGVSVPGAAVPGRAGARAGSHRDREWIDHLVESVGLSDRRDHRPGELSGGQRQRVAIARALAMRPPLVLADEPTANLDSSTGESIVALMKRMNREFGTTFIFSTHDSGIVDIADHVIRLKDGLIVENLRPDRIGSLPPDSSERAHP